MTGNHYSEKRNILAVLLAIAMLCGLFSQTVFAGTGTHSIALTSDVHGNYSNLQTWLTNLKNSGTTELEYMVFGGDYSDYNNSNRAEGPVKCVEKVNSVYPGTPSARTKGNHDTAGVYDSGMVYSGADYAIYVVDVVADDYNAAFTTAEINRLDTALNGIDPSIPVFVDTHFPLHYFGSRTTTNAEAMLTMLNGHPNVIMLWGHNHSQTDPSYGTVRKAGDTIQCTSGGAQKTINFTYANLGCMLNGNNGAYGMLATVTRGESGITVTLQYRSLTGTTGSPYSVTIPASGAIIDINNVAVTVTAPRSGNVPNTAGTVTGGPFAGSACVVGWTPGDNPFAADKPYTATVTLTAPEGYAFASGATATVNGIPATAVLSGGNLTVTYQFAASGSGPSYELATTVENGETYLIVANSGSNNYALTTASTTISSTSYLLGSAVTVSGDSVVADGVTNSMLWNFTADGNGYDVKNGDNYLTRKSSGSAGIYISTTEADAAYTDWMYNGTDHTFRTYSTNGSQYYYLYQSSSGSTYYFTNNTTVHGTIYLYKLVDSSAQPITNVAVTDITAPVAGNTPDTTALTATTGVSVSGVTWSPAAATFAYATAYTASVTLTPQSGYRFTSGTAVTVNGASATSKVLNGDGTLTVTYQFAATAADPNVAYQLATSVENGGTYIIAYLSSGNYYALTNRSTGTNYLVETPVDVTGQAVTSSVGPDMLWDFSTATSTAFDIKCGSTGTPLYLLRLTSQTSNGGGYLVTDETDSGSGYSDWIFNSNQLYVSGGSSGSSKYYLTRTSGSGFGVSSTANTSIYLFKKVSTTPAVAINTVAVTGIDTPVASQTPDTTAATATTGVTVGSVSWSPTATTFAYSTAYTASVTLTAQSGYKFTSDTAVTVNGLSATSKTLNSNGTLTVTYTFGATVVDPNATPYQLATSVEAGGTYVIVYKSSSSGSYYALTNHVTTTNYLDTTQVTVSGNYITSSVADTLLWDFSTAETSGMFDIKCDSTGTALLLQRASSSNLIANGGTDPGASYSDWKFEYNSNGSDLYLTGSSSTKYYLSRSSTNRLFNISTTSNSAIYLFKYVQSNTTVGSVAITDITAPAAGVTPDTSAATTTAGVTLSAVTWSPSDATFGYNKIYTASVTLTAQSGYTFTSETAVTVNGSTATSKTLNSDGTLTVTYAFPATANQQITSVAVTGIDIPVAGQTPVTAAATTTAGVTLSAVTWSPSDATFGYNTVYTASVTLTPGADYAFTSGTAVTVNGLPATTKTLNSDGTMTATCTFVATAKQQIGSVAVTGIDVPVVGQTPDAAAATATAGVTLGAITWSPSDTTFGNNKIYTASVTLTAGADYAFTSETAVTVNGSAATSKTLNENGTLTVTYAFPATANQQITSVAVTGIDVPVAGQTPVAAAATATTGVTLSAVTWSPSDATFGYNTAYTASVTITALSGYAFTSGTAVTVNGLPATTKTLNSDGTMTATCTFVATAKQQIGSVAVTGIDTPVAEALADQSATVATVGVALVSDVTWDPDVAAFGYNIAYQASVTLTPADDYTFTSGTTATMNGQTAVAVLNSDGTLTVTYTFPKTENSIGVTLGISGPSELMIGQSATYQVMATLDNVAGVQAKLVFDSNFFELVSGSVSGEVDYTANQSSTITLISVVLKCKASAGTSGTISLDMLKAGRYTGNVSIPAVPVSCAFEDLSVKRVESIASVAITGIAEPEAGVMPDTAAVVETTGVTASAISWTPTDTPFGYNTAYTASVTLTAGTGIAFASGVTATVNGQAATSATLNGDGTLTVTYKFTGTKMQTPNITAQPQNITNIQGATVQVSVTAVVSKGTLSYQWYSNTVNSNSGGTLISGAELNSYTAPTTSTGTTYYYCVVTNSDNSGLGSASAVATSQTAKVVVKPAVIQSSVYTVDAAKDVLAMVTLGTTVSELKGKLLNDPADIKIFDGADEVTSGAVKTGMTVRYYVNGNLIDQLTISVFGDPSGDGDIDIDDILYLRSLIIGTYTMTASETAASDINMDGTIDILDILYIRSHILLTYLITAQ